MITIRVLGALELRVDGVTHEVTATKERLLLALLASQPRQQFSLARIVDNLWPDRARIPANVNASVQVLVSRLRRHLGPEAEALIAHQSAYSLNLGDDAVDAVTFLRCHREGRELLAVGNLEQTVTTLRHALGLWRGQAYEALNSATLDSERRRLEEARVTTWEQLYDAELSLGRHSEVLEELDEVIGLHPFHERFWAIKMTAQYRAGRQADALRTYAALRKLTLEELGFEPTPELQRLELALLEQSPALEWTGRKATATAGPLPTSSAPPQRLPLQPRLTASAFRPLVGREQEKATLSALRDPDGPSRLRAALVGGEPGAGKTRLVTEEVLAAHAAGSIVLAGRCDEQPISPFQAMAEPMQWLLENLPPELIASALPDSTLNKIRQLAKPTQAQGAEVQYSDTNPNQLFEAVASLLRLLAGDKPIVLLFEDVHWLDAPTETLLRYLVRRLEGDDVVLLCTHRVDPAQQTSAMHDFITVLRRSTSVHELTLGRLATSEVTALARSVLGRPVSPETAAALQDETAGNPLFVVELLRHLTDTGALAPSGDFDDATAVRTAAPPESIRELVEQRITLLDEHTIELLTLGAVLGREFDTRTLAAAAEIENTDVLEALEPAAAAGLIEALPEVPGRYTFNHAVTRRTLYDRISHARRLQMHAHIGDVLERSGTGTPAQLALHHYLAAADGPVDKALVTAIAAAREAQHGLALDDGVEVLQRILPLVDARGTTRQRVELRLHLGDAHWWAGDVTGCQNTCAEALDILRRSHEDAGELLAKAVLGRWRNNGAATQGFSAADPDLELIDMIDEALAGLTEHPSLRAALLGRLGIASYWTVPLERRQEIADSAVALARAAGSDSVLLDVLVDRQLSLWTPGAEPQRLQRSVEILALARRLGQTAREADARTFEAVDHLALGNAEAADTAIRRYLRVSSTLRQPFYRWHAHFLPALRALMDGRFDEAESLTAAATDEREAAGGAEGAFALTGLQTLWLFYERGLLHEIAPILETVVDNFGDIPAMDAARTWVAAEAGNVELAMKMLDDLMEADFGIAQTDIAWLAAMCLLSSAAATIGHTDACRRLTELIEPYSGRNALVWVGFCAGPVDHYLGRLAYAAGDFEAAERYLDRALRMTEQMNARPLSLRIKLDRCRLAASVDSTSSSERQTELHAVQVSASALGMAGVAADAAEFLEKGLND